MMPLVRGTAGEIHEEIFAEVNYHAAYEPMRSARTTRWNYIRRFGGRRRPVLPNCDDSPSKDLWLAHVLARSRRPEEDAVRHRLRPRRDAQPGGVRS